MTAYILRRFALIIPTLFGIMLISFAIMQFAPGGPVERVIAQITGTDVIATARIGGGQGDGFSAHRRNPGQGGGETLEVSRRAGPRPGVHQEPREAVRLRQAGPRALLPDDEELLMFDFGKSYFRDVSVLQLIKEKLPVSISLGIWMTLITYLDLDPARHPQGRARRREVRHLDVAPARGRLCDPGLPVRRVPAGDVRRRLVLPVVPLARADLRQLGQMSLIGKVADYFWHLALPLIAMSLGAFTTMTFLTQNSFLDEIRKQYVMTAQAKGLGRAPGALRPRVPQRHAADHRRLSRRLHQRLLLRRAADRDDLLARRPRPAVASKASINRDYPVVFATLYIFSRARAWSSTSCPTSSTRWSIRASTSRRGRSEPMDQRKPIDASPTRAIPAATLSPDEDRESSGSGSSRLLRACRPLNGGAANFKANRRGYWSF